MAIITPLSSYERHVPGLGWALRMAPVLADYFREGSACRRDLLALKPGDSCRRDLGGGVFVIDQAYETQEEGARKFETHLRHIDIQLVVAGREFMGVGPVAAFRVSEPYSPENDATFYHPRVPTSLVLAEPGTVAIFFADDAHCGRVAVEGPEIVRKAVVKVPVPAGNPSRSA
jgi:YhcH/YjgK/YiaL family protein